MTLVLGRPLHLHRLSLLRVSTIFPQTFRISMWKRNSDVLGSFLHSDQLRGGRGREEQEKRLGAEGLEIMEGTCMAHTVIFKSMNVSPWVGVHDSGHAWVPKDLHDLEVFPQLPQCQTESEKSRGLHMEEVFLR